jgi:hypothetical protein
LQQQQRSSHIDVELPCKVLAVHVLDKVVACHSSIVDDYVELELAALWVREIVFCHFDKMLRSVLGAHARLHCQRFDAILGGQFRCEVFRDLL